MLSRNTLASFAILKVNLAHGSDYLDYLRPFVFHVIRKDSPEPITAGAVSRLVSQRFGLVIPDRVVEIVLKRMARRKFIKRDHGVYTRAKTIPDLEIVTKMARAERHINAVVHDLRLFSQGTANPITEDEVAVAAICAFLREFDVTCLRAYLRGSAIPRIQGVRKKDIVLVSEYVQHLRSASPVRFDSFIVLLQGHMLANALMCPDLNDAPENYRRVTFYLDTPVLVRALGAEGEAKQAAVHELTSLVKSLGGTVAAFSHSRDELERVLRGAADHVDRR